MSTAELRAAFLINDLFLPGEISLALTELDRLLIGGIVPAGRELHLPRIPDLGTSFFAERRELGIFNLGQPGIVEVDSEHYELQRLDCLYIGKGHRDITFTDSNGGNSRFLLASCPAHARFPTRKVPLNDVKPEVLGSPSRASSRRLHRFIHPDGTCSAQLVMGFTETADGSVWNTMPPHTHSRRSEIYFYFDLQDEIVVHLMGTPDETRHLVVRENEAVLSPPWSIHMGAGTGSYRFLWIMAGENQDFADIDPAPIQELC